MLLEEMLTELRYEARISGDPAHGSHLADRHTALLRRTQEQLALQYDWPALTVVRTVSVSAGQRYVGYPDQIDMQNVRAIWQQNTSGDWLPMLQGISAEHLNAVDSDANEQRENPARWANYLGSGDTTISQTLFEVWPIPNRAVTLRVDGQRKLLSLTQATDISTLDGPMIVLYAAAELLAGQKAEDASLKLQLAKARLDAVKSRQQSQFSDPITTSRPVGGMPSQRFRIPE